MKIDYGYGRRRCNFRKGNETVQSKDYDLTEKSDNIGLQRSEDCKATSFTPPQ